jgi:hypothetical protein
MSAKKQTKSVLNRKDLVEIGRIANLSEATVRKWWDGSLNVKPETEEAIYGAAQKFYADQSLNIVDHIAKLDAIQGRIEESKTKLKAALKAMK